MGISVGRVTAKRATYYTNAVAKGKEDYYSGHGEAPPTRFIPRTDGIVGELEIVDVEEVAEALKVGDEKDDSRIVAFDLTYSPPKSVSSIWAMASPEDRRKIELAIMEASQAAIGSMHFYSRRGHAGEEIIEAPTPATMFNFRHRMNRLLQPQLHHHTLIQNATLCADGKVRTLDGREIYAQAKLTGLIGDSVLRRRLTEVLGIVWEPTKANGASGEIVGVSKELIAFWSARRADIESKLDEWRMTFEDQNGRVPSLREARKASQGFTLSSRDKKSGVYSMLDCLVRWQAEAAVMQINPLADAQAAAKSFVQRLKGTIKEKQDRLVGGGSVDKVEEILALVGGSTQATHNCWQLEIFARQVAPQNERETVAGWNERIKKINAEVLATGEIINIFQPVIDASNNVRGDGLPGIISPRQVRFATLEELEKERKTIEIFAQPHPAPELARAVRVRAETALRNGELSAEQAAAIIKLGEAGTIGAVLIGAPGTGKTTSLGVFAEGAAAGGYKVTGLAATGKAAGEVREAVKRGGGESSTIDAWLGRQRYISGVMTNEALIEFWKSQPQGNVKEVLVLDEGSLTSNSHFSHIAAYTEYTGAKLLIIGDHKQIGSVEKGGILLAVATAKGDAAERIGVSRIPTATIETVVRQNEEWERRAAEKLRVGGATAVKAIDAYAEHDRIHGATSERKARDEIAQRVADDVVQGKESIAIGYSATAVRELNLATVKELVSRGELSEKTLPDFQFRTGQQVQTRKNVYDEKGVMTIKNGDRWKVLGQSGIGEMAKLEVAHIVTVERQSLEREYVERILSDKGRAVRHGYASTDRTIQSASLEGSAYALGANTAVASSILVSMTRGKESNHMWVVVGQEGRRDDPLIAQTEQVNPKEDAAKWVKEKAKEAPSENDYAAIHHEVLAENLATEMKKAEKSRARAKEERDQRNDQDYEIGR